MDVREEMTRQTGEHMVKGLDAKVTECLDELSLGWTLANLEGRLWSFRFAADGPLGPTTYTLDGKPFLRVWPWQTTTECDGDSVKLRLTQNFQRINP